MMSLNPHLQLQYSGHSIKNLWPWTFSHGGGSQLLPFKLNRSCGSFRKNVHHGHGKVLRGRSLAIKAEAVALRNKGAVKAVVTVQRTVDKDQDMLGKSLLLEFYSAELNPVTGTEGRKITAYAHYTVCKDNELFYEADFQVPPDFGMIGAVAVENKHHTEMFLKNIVLSNPFRFYLSISCNSWVHSKFDDDRKRIFFTNKSYLPSETPSGLRRMREVELEVVRGNGVGERKSFERIYDYDVYNDLGDPDSNPDMRRPVLGGKQHPYPRRCRTGRPRCKTDPLSETREGSWYIPRDETFSEEKQGTFQREKALHSTANELIPMLQKKLGPGDFPYFTAIDMLFDQGIGLSPERSTDTLKSNIPRIIKVNDNTHNNTLLFETPEAMDRDKFFWLRDEEIGRQTLAGLNPCSIRLVTEWPLKSNLDPAIYGPPESAITKEMIEQQIGSFMTLEEAIENKKLFILDHHDTFLQYVKKVRGLKGTTLYGSRTLFFLNPDETLRPVAIELTRPPMDGKPQWKEAYAPSQDASGLWLWRLAKAHVLSHDTGYHQLVSHWLRTHCCTEPYVIATNRQLSAMHPIYRLLNPHFRYTMAINVFARQSLINAGGIIENTFSPGKYCFEFSSFAYDLLWRFDHEALPADLITRGLAVEDPNEPHGLKLAIKDYPFANDGLLIWDALKQWVSDYVNHYYPDPKMVEADPEIQAWWTEIRTVGHSDKKDEPWWPELKTPKDLINIITTIAWVTSGHHAAVNFGQYAYAGYFPNRPTIARTPMPTETHSEDEWRFFMEKPEVLLLKCFPSQIQATTAMSTLDVLSNHSPDEEFLGENVEAAWEEDLVVKAAFEQFKGRLMEAEGIIDGRNANKELRNRNGAGILPYELLKPKSEPGVTGKGVPYSISI